MAVPNPDPGFDDENDAEAPDIRTSWRPIDLGPYIRGEIIEPEPASLCRVDGVSLLYPGKTHWISGEPEGCKTWLALAAVAEVLGLSQHAVYLDFEGGPATIVERLLELGVPGANIDACLIYIRPEAPMNEKTYGVLHTLIESMDPKPTIAVIDGVNAAMGTSGLDSNKAGDFYRWWGALGRLLQKNTKGPLVAIDHVVKDANARGSYASGTGQKQAAIDVHIGVEVRDRFGIGMTGRMRLVLHKDRAGRLRQHEAKDKTIGILVLESDPENKAIKATIEAPRKEGAVFRPTVLMEKASRYVEAADKPVTKNRIADDVPGKKTTILTAVDILFAEEYLTRSTSGPYTVYTSSKPYREADDGAAG